MRAGVAGALLAAVRLLAPPAALAHGSQGAPPPTDPIAIATAWAFEPVVIVGLALAGTLYLLAVRRVDRAHPGHPWPRHRTAFLLGGLATVAIALLSPVDALSDDLAWIHMIQHSLLTFVAAPLLVASGVVTLALRAASHARRERLLLPVLRSRAVKALTFPLVGWVALVATLWGSHWSDLYNAALLDANIHILEHALFFGAALLFWTPVFSPDPSPWRLAHPAKLLFLFTQMPPMSFLSVTILNAATVLYPAYLGRSTAFGLAPLADQQLSGAIMWGAGDGAFLIAMGLVVWDWMRSEEAETARHDARIDRERSRPTPLETAAPEPPRANDGGAR